VPPNLGLAAPGTLAALDGVAGLPPLDAAPDLPPDTLLVDMAVAERLLAQEGRVSRLILGGDGASRVLPEALADRLEIRPPQGAGDLARLTDSFHLNLTAFGFLSFVVGLFIVHAAIGLAFEQRRPAFRTLRACGVSARMLAAVMLGELLVFALLAGAAGVIAGYLVASALLPDVAASLRGLYGARVPGSLSLLPSWWLAGLGMAVLGALAAGSLALVRAWRLPLLATAQPEAWHGAERRSLRVQGAIAALAFALALAALMRGGGLAAGFTVMGGLLIGAALLLPAILAGLLALAARAAKGPITQWILADSRQQMSGLSLALMALLLALAVNIGVGTMVGSFRATFIGWLDQRLAAEVYLTARDAAEAEAITAWIDARPEVTARLPIWSAEAVIAGWPAEVYGFEDHATYRDNWPMLALLPDGWDRVAAGEAAMVSEQLARREGLAPGDALVVPTPQGAWQVAVAGIYSDYGNPEGQIMIAVEALVARWPDVERLRYALRVEPDAVAPLIAGLRETFGFPDERLIDQAALKDLSTRIFERTFTVTLALNALTLAVAGIALLTALLTLANLRLRQLAPVWALGLTRRRLALIEMGKTLGLAALTAIVALPLGLAVAWVLTAVVNVEAFGWRLPIMLFPGRWVTLFALALATAFLAALWPVLRLRRTAPLTLLQSFTNER
jgi:putative ABC transport system permease protein